jgi:hypothetical protein
MLPVPSVLGGCIAEGGLLVGELPGANMPPGGCMLGG